MEIVNTDKRFKNGYPSKSTSWGPLNPGCPKSAEVDTITWAQQYTPICSAPTIIHAQ